MFYCQSSIYPKYWTRSGFQSSFSINPIMSGNKSLINRDCSGLYWRNNGCQSFHYSVWPVCFATMQYLRNKCYMPDYNLQFSICHNYNINKVPRKQVASKAKKINWNEPLDVVQNCQEKLKSSKRETYTLISSKGNWCISTTSFVNVY